MLKEKIDQDTIQALKEKDETTLSTLRMLKASMMNFKIEVRTKEGAERELTDQEIMLLIAKELKKREEAKIEFEKGNRPDLAEQEFAEAQVLKGYLPEQLSEEEVREEVIKVITENGISDVQEMGRVIKEVMAHLAGRTGGEVVSRIAREELSK